MYICIDTRGESPFWVTTFGRHIPVFEWLLRHGVPKSALTEPSTFVFYYNFFYQYKFECILDIYQETPLMIACEYNMIDIMDFLWATNDEPLDLLACGRD